MKVLFTIFLCCNTLFFYAQRYNGPESVEFDYVKKSWFIGNKNNETVMVCDINGNFSPIEISVVLMFDTIERWLFSEDSLHRVNDKTRVNTELPDGNYFFETVCGRQKFSNRIIIS